MKKIVSIIIPAYNEEESLPVLHGTLCDTLSKIPHYDWEILYVNDGSTDNTQDVIQGIVNQHDNVAFLELSRNFGKEKAMLAGFDFVNGDCAIIMDADLQHSPTLIPEMLRYWEEGFEDVYVKRNSRGRESWSRKKLSMLFYNILDNSTNFEILKNVGDFRLLDRKCIDALKNLREGERYTKGLYCWIGFKKKEIISNSEDRKYGKSHWKMSSLIGLALDGITSFSIVPLRLATIIGFITGIGAIFYLVWTIIKVLIWGEPVVGYPTLICVILLLGSVQLISIGIVGEYIGRIFNETKQRPNYIISNYHKAKYHR